MSLYFSASSGGHFCFYMLGKFWTEPKSGIPDQCTPNRQEWIAVHRTFRTNARYLSAPLGVLHNRRNPKIGIHCLNNTLLLVHVAVFIRYGTKMRNWLTFSLSVLFLRKRVGSEHEIPLEKKVIDPSINWWLHVFAWVYLKRLSGVQNSIAIFVN